MFIKLDTISLRFNNILLTLKDINLISKNSIIQRMKKIYSVRHFMALLIFCCCSSGNLLAQIIMPDPILKLPYKQDFSTWPIDGTSFLPGFQGWVAGGNTSGQTSYVTDATLTANGTIIAGKDAANTAGSFYNYDGKIGFLNTSGLNLTLGFAFSTIGKTAIPVQYDAITIRNPYDIPPKTTNSRINEMVLQYRIGDNTAFVTLDATAYRNNTENQLSGVKDQKLETKKIILPVECENKPLVQIRWISRQESGGGSRPSFAIDNIIVGRDDTAPINETGYPKTAAILGQGFDFVNKIDEIGKTYYVLLPGGSTAPTIAQVKAGQDSNGIAALQSGFLDITNASLEYVKSFTGLSLNTAYSVFSISEDPFNNIQENVTKTDVTTASVLVPSLATTVASLDLGLVEQDYNSDNLSYQIQGANISTGVTVSATGNFTVSKDGNNFATSILYAATDFASNATPTVYVRFTPTAAESFSGQITHEITGGATKIVTLTGIGTNPYIEGFNSSNVLTNGTWTQYDVAGPLNKWSTTTVARNVNSGTGAVLMNGYSDTGASKDWLISPRLRLDNTAKFDKMALLSFYSRKFYAGSDLKLMVSTNYDGKSNPETATWTELDGKFPTTTGSYFQSQYIKLDAYKTNNTYLAWVYETTAGGTNNAAEWSIDDFAITNEIGYVDSNPNLNFGVVNQGNTSATQLFTLKAENYGDITLTAPADYQLSLDNVSFQSSVFVTSADALAIKTIYARFVPSVKTFAISGALTVAGTSLNKKIGFFTGSSLPQEDTFDVVTYNLEFFGAPTAAYGPADKTIQLENVAKVMNKLNADVYVVQEVSSDAQIDALIQKININGKTFDKTISTSWSYSWDSTADPSFPPQKLVILYNTQTATIKATKVMFKDLYDEVRAGTKSLANYPGGSGSSFFSSGRLPYMVQIETNIGGTKKLLNLVDLHARANSGTDISKYNQRKYDSQVLKDSLDQYYANSNLIILGDYNDDVKASVITPNPSSYKMFVDDTANYTALTLEISKAGAYSFLSSGGFLDHIMISNELNDQYIQNSIAVYDPRADIANYTTTTSDHGPVIARFQLTGNLSTIDYELKNGYLVKAYPNPATDIVNVEVKTNDTKKLKLKFYDISGHLIGNSVEINATQDLSTTAIPVSYLQSGIYFYTLTENNKVVYKGKVIKK